MPRYRVSQRQVVTYWWYVDADSAEQACLSDCHGVPDQAFSRLRAAETDAVALREDEVSEDASVLVLPRWRVTYQIAAGVSAGQMAADGAVTVRALDDEIAGELAEAWVVDNDPRHDDRIQPQVRITSAELITEPAGGAER